MKYVSIDISRQLQNVLPFKTFVFNPSIVELTKNKYLVAFRSFLNNPKQKFDRNPKLLDNPQHAWHSKWKGAHDKTYIVPIRMTPGGDVSVIPAADFPIEIAGQDARLFHFVKDGDHVAYIVTFNRSFDKMPDLVIKNGDTCGDYCYIIDWMYLIVNVDTLRYSLVPSAAPLCTNISSPIEKNWSLWTVRKKGLTNIVTSYALTPTHSAFSFILDTISGGVISASSICKMITPRTDPKIEMTLLEALEKYYPGLFVSLSTPAYEIEKNVYQAVGHLKVKRDKLTTVAGSNLAKFADKWARDGSGKYFHPLYVYFMYIYRFKIAAAKPIVLEEAGSQVITLQSTDRITAQVTHITDAFMISSAETEYFLNFPAGLVIGPAETIISYGNGDVSSHLLILKNGTVNKMMHSVSKMDAKDMQFKFL